MCFQDHSSFPSPQSFCVGRAVTGNGECWPCLGVPGFFTLQDVCMSSDTPFRPSSRKLRCIWAQTSVSTLILSLSFLLLAITKELCLSPAVFILCWVLCFIVASSPGLGELGRSLCSSLNLWTLISDTCPPFQVKPTQISQNFSFPF